MIWFVMPVGASAPVTAGKPTRNALPDELYVKFVRLDRLTVSNVVAAGVLGPRFKAPPFTISDPSVPLIAALTVAASGTVIVAMICVVESTSRVPLPLNERLVPLGRRLSAPLSAIVPPAIRVGPAYVLLPVNVRVFPPALVIP